MAAALMLLGLGDAPFVDPPEGFHAEIAREMGESGDWITPHLDGIRYFDKPPLQYWLMATGFALGGPSPGTARLWSALAAIGCAAVTAGLGILLGGPRVGLLAGSMVVTNLGVFLFGRIVKPDLLFIFWITLAYLAFSLAYLGRGPWALALCYVSLGFAMMSKDMLGVAGPVLAIALFLWLTGEGSFGAWVPWWGIGLLALVVVPWHLAVEVRNHGFLWYTTVDHHVLNFLRRRVFPDEDAPLTALEFLVVTAAAFLPWTPAAVLGTARTLSRRGPTPAQRLWLLQAIWALLVVGFFSVSPFKLPHYGLPAFPALALLAARGWDAVISGERAAPRVATLLVPVFLVFVLAGSAMAAAWAGILPLPRGALGAVDVATRSVTARGGRALGGPLDHFQPFLGRGALVLTVAAAGLAVAVWRRAAVLGLAVALAAMAAFLPLAGRGMVDFARSRSTEPIALALVPRLTPAAVVVHEGALENSASLLLALRRRVHVVGGLQSSLAFGATFPEGRETFWSLEQLHRAWRGPDPCFLVSSVEARQSVVRELEPATVHLLVAAGGRRLYANHPP